MPRNLFEPNNEIKFNSLQDVEDYAKELCVKYGIPETRIEWSDTALKRYGQADHLRKLITLSKQPVEHNLHKTFAITDLLLHEIAHLLVGPGHRHNKVWKAKCVEIGAVPEATVKSHDTRRTLPTPSKYVYVCSHCGKEVHTHRKLYGRACLECCTKYNNGKWDPEFLLILRKNLERRG